MHISNLPLESLSQFLQTPVGLFAFIILYALWVTLLLPGIWGSMLAGVLYGTWVGSAVVFLGAFFGAQAAFWISRSIFRNWIKARISQFPKFDFVQKAISRQGLQIVFLSRLSPVFPFSLMNFAYGLSDIKPIDYSIGLAGILPGTIFYCGLGKLAGNFSKFSEVLNNNQSSNYSLVSLLGLISTLAIIFIITRAATIAIQDFDSSI